MPTNEQANYNRALLDFYAAEAEERAIGRLSYSSANEQKLASARRALESARRNLARAREALDRTRR